MKKNNPTSCIPYYRFNSHVVYLLSVRRLLVTANAPVLLILVTLMMEALRSSETSVITTATRRRTPEDSILRSHRRETLKSYLPLTGWALERRRTLSPVSYELGLYIPEDGILYSHCRENTKSYITITGSMYYCSV
jgi:hypothetical protein